MTMPSQGLRTLFAGAMLLSLSAVAAGCPDSRALGETCVTNDQCASGFCYGECLEPNVDLDKDGLTNANEKAHQSNPLNPDSDDDGVPDEIEYGKDPKNPTDTDKDGRIDAVESLIDDSDNDCIPDQLDAEDGVRNNTLEELNERCPNTIDGVCGQAPHQVSLSCEVIDGVLTLTSCDETTVKAHLDVDICGNGLDDDCDGTADGEGCVPLENCLSKEICGNGTDDDCDGIVDEAACTSPACLASEICANGIDDDCNGSIDDGCGTCTPGAEELCDGIQNDCDGPSLTRPDGILVSDLNRGAGSGEPGDPFPTIQDAIDHAASLPDQSEPHEIRVVGGVFPENLVIDSGVNVHISGSWDCDFQTQVSPPGDNDEPTAPPFTLVQATGAIGVNITGQTRLSAEFIMIRGADGFGVTETVKVSGGSSFTCAQCGIFGGNGDAESWAIRLEDGEVTLSGNGVVEAGVAALAGAIKATGGKLVIDKFEVNSEKQDPNVAHWVGIDAAGVSELLVNSARLNVGNTEVAAKASGVVFTTGIATINNSIINVAASGNTTDEQLAIHSGHTGVVTLTNNFVRVDGEGSSAVAVYAPHEEAAMQVLNNILYVTPGEAGERWAYKGHGFPDIFARNELDLGTLGNSGGAGNEYVPERPFALTAPAFAGAYTIVEVNTCARDNCGISGQNYALGCATNMQDPKLLPADSPCVDRGLDPKAALNVANGFPNELFDVDAQGVARADGAWDIGPAEATGAPCPAGVSACPQGDGCRTAVCTNSLCSLVPTATFDLDGDGSCDSVDGDIDGDGVDNGVDCAPEDSSVFQGNIDLVCDGIASDCSNGTDYKNSWHNDEAVFVQLDFVPATLPYVAEGSREAPYRTLTEALNHPQPTPPRPILVLSGETAVAGDFTLTSEVRIIGGFAGCDFMKISGDTTTKLLIESTSGEGVTVSGPDGMAEFERVELSVNHAGEQTALTVEFGAQVILRDSIIKTGPGATASRTSGVHVADSGSFIAVDSVIKPDGSQGSEVFGIDSVSTGTVRLVRTLVDLGTTSAGDMTGVRSDGPLDVISSAIRINVQDSPPGDVVGVDAHGRTLVTNSLVRLNAPGGEDTVGLRLSAPNEEKVRLINNIIDVPGMGAGTPSISVHFNDQTEGELDGRNNAVNPTADGALWVQSLGMSFTEFDQSLPAMSAVGAVLTESSLMLSCPGTGPPEFALDSGSQCFGRGTDVNSILLDVDVGLGITGAPFDTNDWNIGPNGAVGTPAPGCISDNECAATGCDTASCVDLFCLTTPGLDTDGDGECDADDNNDDNDGFPDSADCAPLDKDSYPGAPDICGDNLDNNCTDPGTPPMPWIVPVAGDYFISLGANLADADGTPTRPWGSLDDVPFQLLAGGPAVTIHVAHDDTVPLPTMATTLDIPATGNVTIKGGYGCDWQVEPDERPILRGVTQLIKVHGTLTLESVALEPAADIPPSCAGSEAAFVEGGGQLTATGVTIVTSDGCGNNFGIRALGGASDITLTNVSVTAGRGSQSQALSVQGNSNVTIEGGNYAAAGTDGSAGAAVIAIEGAQSSLVMNRARVAVGPVSTSASTHHGLSLSGGTATVVNSVFLVSTPSGSSADAYGIRAFNGNELTLLQCYIRVQGLTASPAAGIQFETSGTNGAEHKVYNTAIDVTSTLGRAVAVELTIGGDLGAVVLAGNVLSGIGDTQAPGQSGAYTPDGGAIHNAASLGPSTPRLDGASLDNLDGTCQVHPSTVRLMSVASSDCLDTGVALTTAVVGTDLWSADFHGVTRAQGPKFDIGPAEAPQCNVDADCAESLCDTCDDSIKRCVFDSEPDYDGDGVCDVEDDDDDNDGIDDVSDGCAKSEGTGADKDSDGCHAAEDCNDDPQYGALFYPGAEDTECDGGNYDCDAGLSAGLLFAPPDAVFVDADYDDSLASSDGTQDAPYTTISDALANNIGGGVFVVASGVYNESLDLDSIGVSDGAVVTIVGGRDPGCGFETHSESTTVRSESDHIIRWTGATSGELVLKNLVLEHGAGAEALSIVQGVGVEGIALRMESVTVNVASNAGTNPGLNHGVVAAGDSLLEMDSCSVNVGLGEQSTGLSMTGFASIRDSTIALAGSPNATGINANIPSVSVERSVVTIASGTGMVIGVSSFGELDLVSTVIDVNASGTNEGLRLGNGHARIIGSSIRAGGAAVDAAIYKYGGGSTTVINSELAAPSGSALAKVGTSLLYMHGAAVDAAKIGIYDTVGMLVPPLISGSIELCSWAGCSGGTGNIEAGCGNSAPAYALPTPSICNGAGADLADITSLALPGSFVLPSGYALDLEGEARAQGAWDIGPDEAGDEAVVDADNDGVSDDVDPCLGSPAGDDEDGDGCEASEDCNDNEASVYPGASNAPACDGILEHNCNADPGAGIGNWAKTDIVLFVRAGATGVGTSNDPMGTLSEALTSLNAQSGNATIVIDDSDFVTPIIVGPSFFGLTSLTILGGRDGNNCDWPMANGRTVIQPSVGFAALSVSEQINVHLSGIEFRGAGDGANFATATQMDGDIEFNNVVLKGSTSLAGGEMVAFDQTGGTATFLNSAIDVGNGTAGAVVLGIRTDNGGILELLQSHILLNDPGVLAASAVGIQSPGSGVGGNVVTLIQSSVEIRGSFQGSVKAIDLGGESRLLSINSVLDVAPTDTTTEARGIFTTGQQHIDMLSSSVSVGPEALTIPKSAIEIPGGQGWLRTYNSQFHVPGAGTNLHCIGYTNGAAMSHEIRNNYFNCGDPFRNGTFGTDICDGTFASCFDNLTDDSTCVLSGSPDYEGDDGDCVDEGIDPSSILTTTFPFSDYLDQFDVDYDGDPRTTAHDIGPDQVTPCVTDAECPDVDGDPCTIESCNLGLGVCESGFVQTPTDQLYIDADAGAATGGDGSWNNPWGTLAEAMSSFTTPEAQHINVSAGTLAESYQFSNVGPQTMNLTLSGGWMRAGGCWLPPTNGQKTTMTSNAPTTFLVDDFRHLELLDFIVAVTPGVSSAMTAMQVGPMSSMDAERVEFRTGTNNASPSSSTALAIIQGDVELEQVVIAPGRAEQVFGIHASQDPQLMMARSTVLIGTYLNPGPSLIRGIDISSDEPAPTGGEFKVRIDNSTVRILTALGSETEGIRMAQNARLLFVDSVVELDVDRQTLNGKIVAGIRVAGEDPSPLDRAHALVANSAIRFLGAPADTTGHAIGVQLHNAGTGNALEMVNTIIDNASDGIKVEVTTANANLYSVANSYFLNVAHAVAEPGSQFTAELLNTQCGLTLQHCVLGIVSGNNWSDADTPNNCVLSPAPDYALATGADCASVGAAIGPWFPSAYLNLLGTDLSGQSRCPLGGVLSIGPNEPAGLNCQ